jgi:hypothetical protein
MTLVRLDPVIHVPTTTEVERFELRQSGRQATNANIGDAYVGEEVQFFEGRDSSNGHQSFVGYLRTSHRHTDQIGTHASVSKHTNSNYTG